MTKRTLGYGPIAPSFQGDDDLVGPLFRGEAKSSAAGNRFAKFREGPIEVFPDVFSWDKNYLIFLDKLSRKLSTHPDLLPSVDELGRVGANGVRGNFYGLRHLTGYPMEPATMVLADNTGKRNDAKLAQGPINVKHELLFRSYVRLFFRDLENTGLRIARGTSTGVPAFKKTMASKLFEAKAALANAKKAGTLYLDGNYHDAFILYDFGGAYFIVYREQTTDGVQLDKGVWIEKKRLVADIQYALTGGREGTLFEASKSVLPLKDEHYIPDGFFATRRRTAGAAPFTSNAVLMVIAQSVRKRIYDEYSFTTNHTTRLQKQEKVARFDFGIATDVSDHDTFWPGWLLDIICDELNNMGFAPWWVEILRTTMRLPVYISAPSRDVTKGHVLIGDWRNPKMNSGLMSGIGVTDLMGTLLMGPVYQIIQMDHTADHLWNSFHDQQSCDDFVSSYLKGNLEIAQMSKSDDAKLLWKKGPSMAKAISLLKTMKEGKVQVSPYMLVTYEHGGAFLGDLLVYDHTKDLKNARFMGNILSYVQNLFSPEYSIDTNKPDRAKRGRPFPGLAVSASVGVFGGCPAWLLVNELIEETWFEVYGVSFRQMRIRQEEDDKAALAVWVQQRAELEGIFSLTPADHEVLAEPSKLGWKFNPEDINPAVVEMVSSGLSKEDTLDFFTSVVPKRNTYGE